MLLHLEFVLLEQQSICDRSLRRISEDSLSTRVEDREILMNLLWDSHQEDSRHLLYEHGPHLSNMMVVVVVVTILVLVVHWFALVYVFVSPKLASCVCWASDNAGSRQ